MITRALGTDATVQVDTQTIPIAPGDVVLLCSDGLTSMLPSARIAELVVEDASPDSLSERLVDAANRAGGEDNITVVVFELTEGEPPERPVAPPPDAPAKEPSETVSPTAPAVVRGRSVRRHGASGGSRWPALLFLLAVLLVGALALWWGITR